MMNDKEENFLKWLHKMREEEKKKREKQPVKLYLEKVREKTDEILENHKMNIPIIERTGVNL